MVVFFDIDGTLVDYKYAEKAGAIQFYREHVEVFKFTYRVYAKKRASLCVADPIHRQIKLRHYLLFIVEPLCFALTQRYSWFS